MKSLRGTHSAYERKVLNIPKCCMQVKCRQYQEEMFVWAIYLVERMAFSRLLCSAVV